MGIGIEGKQPTNNVTFDAIDQLIDRGERLETLVQRTDDISRGGQAFQVYVQKAPKAAYGFNWVNIAMQDLRAASKHADNGNYSSLLCWVGSRAASLLGVSSNLIAAGLLVIPTLFLKTVTCTCSPKEGTWTQASQARMEGSWKFFKDCVSDQFIEVRYLWNKCCCKSRREIGVQAPVNIEQV